MTLEVWKEGWRVLEPAGCRVDSHRLGYVPDMAEGNALDALAVVVSELARTSSRTVAVAESLTGGMIATALAKAPAAGDWFRGALVAYSSDVKHEVLDVPDGPVVSEVAAQAMAHNVRMLLGADVAVAVTGAGGPDPQDGRRPGTVYVAVTDDASSKVAHLQLAGDPDDVCAATARSALDMLAVQLTATRIGATAGSSVGRCSSRPPPSALD